ncbi:Hpt domain-containing protein [Sphingomonas naphthae]|uniref:Hpt domain-containing protein n=1 Tax=Sphingomonas naphthae TaxID=1813468 RepID=A0ABY7TP86_9SPHN|nr:Hpt domain-containing protein [Sphingomonas naphthae]WCT73659.1 Hpt domain-containing protein [Sphingomonas naphthae]
MAIIDWAALAKLKAEIGAEFPRILGYFREDGVRSIVAIEDAMRARDAARVVRPAHTLKGESAQFGAEPLRLLSEQIERGARRCVETHDVPDELLEHVVQLRPLLQQTLAMLEAHAAPGGPTAPAPVLAPGVPRRPQGFGRKVGGFGRG